VLEVQAIQMAAVLLVPTPYFLLSLLLVEVLVAVTLLVELVVLVAVAVVRALQ
jgi:hypothetical protein